MGIGSWAPAPRGDWTREEAEGITETMLRILVALLLCFPVGCANTFEPEAVPPFGGDSKPYVRWWWFASEIDVEACRWQLDWLKEHGFGGVEIAFIYPPGRDPEAERFEFLGPEWTAAIAATKRHADAIGLGCDFTFGTLWPFGGSFVSDADRTRIYGEPDWHQHWRLSWEHDTPGNVLNHMDAEALGRYADRVGTALAPALAGSTSALFCDSWEVETRRIWTEGLGDRFEKRFGYRIEPFMEELYAPETAGPRYDYMKLVSETVIDEFFLPFTEICHDLGALSRVQCAGAPADILAAYAAVDIPESEAMLYEPRYARLPASAAAFTGRPVVSAESFTCLYGFPAEHFREENILDLKLVADAMFANGVNHIVWHGTPFNGPGGDVNTFYATVHVGRDGALAPELYGFNHYLATVSAALKRGRTYTDAATYLPLEDAWIAGEYPEDLQMRWSWGEYELRYVRPARDLAGHHPLWVSGELLRGARFTGGELIVGEARFTSLHIAATYVESDALDAILRLARAGLPVALVRDPREPGHVPSGDYAERVAALRSLPNVDRSFLRIAPRPPLVKPLDDGPPLEYWCRREGDTYTLFFANPTAYALTFPLDYERALTSVREKRSIVLHVSGVEHAFELDFLPGQSILLEVDAAGVRELGAEFVPLGPEVW